MKKRFLSLFLALTVCMALSVPAFADRSGALSGGVYWLMDAGTDGADGVLEFDGKGTITSATSQIPPDVFEDARYIDVSGGITGIDSLAFAPFTCVKGVRISSTVTEIGDLFGDALNSMTKPIVVYGEPGSAAEDFVNRANERTPGAFRFLNSNTYQLGEDPNLIPINSCGENTSWYFEEVSKVLYIIGSGSTADYESGADTPWLMYAHASTEVAVIEEGVTRLGDRIFAGNSSLLSVSLPSSLTTIGTASFTDSELWGIYLDASSNLTAIGPYAFAGCHNLASFDIPGGVTRLESGTFERCSNLTSISIPVNVTYICDYVFTSCDSLTDIYYEGTAEQWAKIQISDNASIPSTANIHYNSYTPAGLGPGTPANPGQIEPGGQETDFHIVPTASTVLVNGANVAFDAYNINGANYFKLRDLAMALNGSAKQFEVSWDATANAISLISGQPYTAVGGELAVGNGNVESFRPTDSKILLNGAEVALEAYNIGGNNYFKLRDLGSAFDFGVDWDGANNTVVIDTSKGYTPG